MMSGRPKDVQDAMECLDGATCDEDMFYGVKKLVAHGAVLAGYVRELEEQLSNEPLTIDGTDCTDIFEKDVDVIREAAKQGGEFDYVWDNVGDDIELALTELRRLKRRNKELEAENTRKDAMIAEHHPDDDVAVTKSWLQSVGFSKRKCSYIPMATDRNWHESLSVGPLYLHSRGTWSYGNQCLPRTLLETRGDVRRLCKALGIELKDKEQN